MNIDKDKENITGEQKIGKYNILLNALKFIGIFIFVLLQTIAVCMIIKYKYVTFAYIVISFIAILHLILVCKIKEYKIVWIVLILLFPIIGSLLYFLGGDNSFSKKQKNKLNNIEKSNKNIIERSNYIDVEELNFVSDLSTYKVYNNQGIEFFNTGEEFFCDLIQELKKAKKSILIDIYILSKGELLDKIIKVLKDKIKEGVIVEIIYDNFGSMFRMPKRLKKDIINSGIKLYTYKKINFNISDYLNHREHKKILLIDGKIAYTGGINLSDEYINKKELHRVWKDGGIKVYGDIVISYLLTYLKIREQITNEKVNYYDYIIDEKYDNNKGMVFVYSDGPDNGKNPVEKIYLNVINKASKYLYIVTPYFMPNKEIILAIINAAKRGVEVKILLPHIADKNIVQYGNRSHYKELLNCGVEVYEYKKGFIHTKYMVTDDISLVGTANLDYKSLYFNFECMNLSYKTGIEEKIKDEFEKDIKESINIKLCDMNNIKLIEKIKYKIAYFLKPLM